MYRVNPAHRRAKLVEVTDAGLEAVRRIGPAHAEAAEKLATELGEDRFRKAVTALRDLSAALTAIGHDG